MSLATRLLKQKAVLFVAGAIDKYGEPSVAAGIQIRVRWEKDSGETLNATNDRVFTNGTVMVDRDITEGSILWEGKLADHVVGTSEDYYKVIAFSKIPNIKGRNPRRVVTLQRHNNSLPTIS